MSTLVCDASVLFKVLISEPDSHLADALVASSEIIVPELAYAELGNAIWSHMRQRGTDQDVGRRLLRELVDVRLDVRSIRPHVPRALGLAATLDHPIYDCIYLALAESLDVPLVTADRRFLAALRRNPLPSIEVKALTEAV